MISPAQRLAELRAVCGTSDPPNIYVSYNPELARKCEECFHFAFNNAPAIAARERELEERAQYHSARAVSAEEQLCWLDRWCEDAFGVRNTEVIGREGWPNRICEVVAKATRDQLAAKDAEIAKLTQQRDHWAKIASTIESDDESEATDER